MRTWRIRSLCSKSERRHACPVCPSAHDPRRIVLVRIRHTMEELSRMTLIKRFVSSSEHTDLLSDHRRRLQDAIAIFQVCQVFRSAPPR